MNNFSVCFALFLFASIIVLSIVVVFCYNQEKIKLIYENKTTLKENELSSTSKVNIDKDTNKKNSK